MNLALRAAAGVLTAAILAAAPARAVTWRAEPTLKYDVICLTGVLADDPYQAQHYKAQRDVLTKLLRPETVAAGGRVHRAFKAAGVPTAGWLSLIYSAAEDPTLEGMIAATEDPGRLRASLEPTMYWYPDRWAIYERTRADMLIYLRGLREAGFAPWWEANVRPEVEAVLGPLRPRLQKLDFGPYIETALGRPAPDVITVHATRFCRPFGARVLGANFLMEVVGKKDPFRSVGAGAIHEMTHPPFDRKDPRVLALVEHLGRDPLIRARFDSRPTDSGYNTFDGYIDEDVTRALDQLIGERVGVTFVDDPNQRFREQEGGFHMAGAVFYHLMKDEGFLDRGETVTEFLDRIRRDGRLSPERTRALAERAYGPLP